VAKIFETIFLIDITGRESVKCAQTDSNQAEDICPARFFAPSEPANRRINLAGKKKGRNMNPLTQSKKTTILSVLIAARLGCFALSPQARADTFTVTNTDDSGAGSLRQAILDANGNSGSDTIQFNIPGSGVHTISPISALPTITDPIIIDGYTQPGASENTLATSDDAILLIELEGSSAGEDSGLRLSGGSSTVRGLVINRFVLPPGDNDPILGNGILLEGPGGDQITGNFIGTDPSGTLALPNTNSGIKVSSPNNVIGGATAGARNVICGNGLGVTVDTSTGNIIQGNFIGTDVTGTKALGLGTGILATSPVQIGGLTATAGTPPGNVISGNLGLGILPTSGSGGSVIQGNLIGTDATGTLPLGNGAGVVIYSGLNLVGGTDVMARNVISGNGGGGIILGHAFVSVRDNLVQGNFIGTDISGTQLVGNNGEGVIVGLGTNNTIGGLVTTAGAPPANVIAGNSGNGVGVISSAFTGGLTIEGNSIFSNGGLGIDLNRNGVTPNDPGDPDTNLQNFPVITSVVRSNGSVQIVGTLDSLPSADYHLEFFGNDAADPSHFGEGQDFLGATEVSTNADGSASFDVSFPTTAGPRITATATDENGNTSEFSLAPTPKLLNISTRLQVLPNDNVLIGGFIITGTVSKNVIVRAIGPSLGDGLTGFLADPTLELHDSAGMVIDFNDNWKDTQQAEIEATGLQPSDDLESAIVETLTPGLYTAIVAGKNGTTGIGLVEAYDLDQAVDSELANISTRGFIDTGDNVMIGGFIIGPDGLGDATVLVRGIGPSLTDFGVPGALQDPTLELHDESGNTLTTNDDWKETQQTEIEATGLAPTDDRESAILSTLAPGAYTAIVRGALDTTGVGLVEAYNIP
jgi:hypothetical protein